MTREEFIKKRCIRQPKVIQDENGVHVEFNDDECLSDLNEVIKDELIKYIKWYFTFVYEYMSDEMLVNEYLKSQQK